MCCGTWRPTARPQLPNALPSPLLRSRLGADSTLSASGLMTMFQSSMGNPRSMVRAAAAFRDSKMRQQRMREEEEASFWGGADHYVGTDMSYTILQQVDLA